MVIILCNITLSISVVPTNIIDHKSNDTDNNSAAIQSVAMKASSQDTFSAVKRRFNLRQCVCALINTSVAV